MILPRPACIYHCYRGSGYVNRPCLDYGKSMYGSNKRMILTWESIDGILYNRMLIAVLAKNVIPLAAWLAGRTA